MDDPGSPDDETGHQAAHPVGATGGSAPAAWQVLAILGTAGAVALWVGLRGPGDGGWRLLLALAAGVLTYAAVTGVSLAVVLAVAMVRARREAQLYARDPAAFYERKTGKPWPPRPPDLGYHPE